MNVHNELHHVTPLTVHALKLKEASYVYGEESVSGTGICQAAPSAVAKEVILRDGNQICKSCIMNFVN